MTQIAKLASNLQDEVFKTHRSSVTLMDLSPQYLFSLSKFSMSTASIDQYEFSDTQIQAMVKHFRYQFLAKDAEVLERWEPWQKLIALMNIILSSSAQPAEYCVREMTELLVPIGPVLHESNNLHDATAAMDLLFKEQNIGLCVYQPRSCGIRDCRLVVPVDPTPRNTKDFVVFWNTKCGEHPTVARFSEFDLKVDADALYTKLRRCQALNGAYQLGKVSNIVRVY